MGSVAAGVWSSSHVASVAPSFQNRRCEEYRSSNVSVPDAVSPAATEMVPPSNVELTGGMPNDSRHSVESCCAFACAFTSICTFSWPFVRSIDFTVTS